jgi:O-antigen/teichoic acid export membrane protein
MHFSPSKWLRRPPRQWLPRSRFVQQVMLAASGAAVGQAIVVVSSPVLTRLYTPEEFGSFGVFQTLVNILGAVACLRYELAVPVSPTERASAEVLGVASLIAVGLGLLTLLVVALWGDTIAGWLDVPGVGPLLWLVAPSLTALGLYQALNGWAIRRGTFGLIATSRLTQPLGQVLPQLALGPLGIGPMGLALGIAIGWVAGASTFLCRLPRIDWEILRQIRPSGMLAAARRHRRFPTYSTLAALLNTSTRLLPSLLLAMLYGPAVAGWFHLAQRVIGLPVQFISVAVSQVYLSEAPKLAHGGGEGGPALYRLFIRTTGRLLVLGLIGIGILAIPGPWLFGLVFGPQWVEAGEIVRLLLPLLLARFVVFPISQTLNMFDRQDLHLIWDSCNGVILAVSFILGWQLRLGPSTTVLLYSLGMSFSYLAHFLIAQRVILRHLTPPAGGAPETPGPS